MLLIKETSVKWVSSYADYKLENGVLLFDMDWNGEIYRNGFDSISEKETNIEYKPVYRFQIDNIDTESEEYEKNSDYYNEIIGFEEM